jgi:hypothetical protein
MSTRFPPFFRAVSGATAAMVLGVALAGPALTGPAATAARPVHAIAPVAGTITVVAAVQARAAEGGTHRGVAATP